MSTHDHTSRPLNEITPGGSSHMSEKDRAVDQCIGCHSCTHRCSFLERYGFTLADFALKPELTYECCLCDDCKRVCPVTLSGEKIAWEHRHENRPRFVLSAALKEHYPLKNTSKKVSESLLFLGCNFPLFYPETTKKLLTMMQELHVDYSVDCCRKPVVESGKKFSSFELDQRFSHKQVQELICVCANCYYTFKRLSLQGELNNIKVISIYEFLNREKISRDTGILLQPYPVFIPCPDRDEQLIFSDIKKYFRACQPVTTTANCCGMGGGVYKRSPQFVTECQDQLHSDLEQHLNNNGGDRTLLTYCSTCCSTIQAHQETVDRSKRWRVVHALSEILGVHEAPSTRTAANALHFALKSYR